MFADLMRVLLGIQPNHVQSPPIFRFSIRAVFLPKPFASLHDVNPAEPAPIITKS
jgi:CRISPR/Cas system endoribonuclease Cas6 (RAMP superfamily)